ncbi:MAG: 3-deoxy-manno-octulosonate cytidylyltransferase [Desulfobulbaceae bacterium]|jgi:3-deoxy-manno-octulosonate cytidylyltransferase (CMP-KDO synthetase)|nr:3-deoxy-manno-octulosonate cytidylyltransferase [Desulfobulbaceae bacterium]
MPAPPCYGIIPARYESKRFPGKPLTPILGKPMIWHVYNRAIQCKDLCKTVLATDDERIFNAAKGYGIPILMTSADHTCGSERVLEAATIMKVENDAVILNIQGDEPALNPAMLSQLATPFVDPAIQVTTLAHKISREEAVNPNQVKVVISKSGRALYFSRAQIPFPRDNDHDSYLGHIGLYGFRMGVLKTFVALENSSLEKHEKLEQLRLMENDIPIHVVITEHQGYGVDRPEDIAIVEAVIKKQQGSS